MTVSLGRLPTIHQRHGIKFCRFVQILQHRIQLLINQDMKLTDSQNDPRRVTKDTITLDKQRLHGVKTMNVTTPRCTLKCPFAKI
jgi:hypothetical protein